MSIATNVENEEISYAIKNNYRYSTSEQSNLRKNDKTFSDDTMIKHCLAVPMC